MIGGLELKRILPFGDDVIAMRSYIAEDYVRMGLEEYTATEKAFVGLNGEDLVQWQAERVAKSISNYVGVYALNRLVAFSHINEWNAADQIPYARNSAEKLALNALSLSAFTNHLFSRPLGVHTILADDQLTHAEKTEAFGLLVGDAISKANYTRTPQIRTQSYQGDPALASLVRHGFRPGMSGKPISDIDFEQTLYIRGDSHIQNGHLAPVIPFPTTPNPRAA